MPEQDPARLGETNPATLPHHQRRAGLRLQPLDLLTDGRLGPPEHARGTGE
jgi:hypothetical protein